MQPAASTWALAGVAVNKKDGGICLGIDCQPLSQVAVAGAFPLPRGPQMMMTLQGEKRSSQPLTLMQGTVSKTSGAGPPTAV